MKPLRIHLFILPVLALTTRSASAFSRTWDGSSSNLWGLAANWTGGIAAASGDDLTFPTGAGNLAMSNNLAIGTSFTKLSFTGAGYTLSGNGLTLNDPTATSASIAATAGTTTIQLPVTLGESCFMSASAGTTLALGSSSSITQAANALTLSGAGNITLAGSSGGSGGVTISSTGSVAINSIQNQSGTYSFTGTGAYTVNARISGGISVGTGATLGGTAGRTFGNCAMNGSLDPGGTGTTTFTVDGNLIFNSDGTGEEVRFDLNGTNAGTTYDQVNVGGAMTTDSTRIVLRPTMAFPIGTAFVLFDKTSAGAITHTTSFFNSAGGVIGEGSQQTVGVNRFQFSYAGGDGNDFTATVVAAPLGTTITWDGGDTNDLLWSSAANWSGDVLPTAGQVLNFGGTATADVATINDLGGNFGRITFTGATGGFSIAPQTLTNFDLTLTDGIQASHGGSACAVNNDLILGASQTFSLTGAANLTIGSGTSTQFNGFDLTVHCAPSSGTPQLNLDAGLSGTGGLIKTGAGRVSVGGVGSSSNSYSGTTTVQEGELRLTRGTIIAPANCIPGALSIGGGANPASVTSSQAEKIADTAIVTVGANGSFLPGAAETIGGLVLNGGTVDSGANVLTVDGSLTANQDTTIASPLQVKTPVRDWTVAAAKTLALNGPLTYSPLSSGFSVNKKGTGTLVLSGISSVTTFSLDEGTLQLENNSATDTIGVQINGGTLSGSGRAIRITSAAPGGVLSPATGTGTGILETTKLTLNAATTVVFDLNGTTAGTGHDQLDVAASTVDSNGTVTLGGAQLVIREAGVASPGTSYVIIKNDGADAVSDTFSGLAQGATVVGAFNRYTISYTGGTGNDVVLTVSAPVVTGNARVWDAGGGADRNWQTATNWVGDVAPLPGDDLEFPTAHTTSVNNFPAGVTFGSIRFTGTPGITIVQTTGAAVQLLGGVSSSVNDVVTSQVTVAIPITFLNAASITNTGKRTLNFSSTLTTAASPLTFAGDAGATQRNISLLTGGTISGPAKLIVDANASVSLGAGLGHTYGGGTEVKFGAVFGAGNVLCANGLTVGDGVNPAFATTQNDATTTAPITINARGTFAPGSTITRGSFSASTLALNGTLANPATVTHAGTVTLTSGLTIDAGDSFDATTLVAPSLTHDGAAATIGSASISGQLRVQSGSLALPNGTTAGSVIVDAGTFTTSVLDFPPGGQHIVFVATTATVASLGDAAFTDLVEKTGNGILSVTNNLQAANVRVSGGFFRNDSTNINLNAGSQTAITLNGGQLQGGGTVGQILATGAAGSQVNPGASPGRLTAASITASNAQPLDLVFEINSNLAAVGFDQIVLAGSNPVLSLAAGNTASVTPVIAPTFTAPIGTEIVLIDNQGPNAISGTFSGKPEGFTQTVGGVSVRYSYVGGTGNDFTLTVMSAPLAGEFRVWDGGGADANWMTAANWVGDVAPLPGDALRFPNGAAQTTNSNNFPAGSLFNGVKIEANYTLNGSSILLTGNVDAQPPGTATLAVPLQLAASRAVILSGGGSLIRSGITELAAGSTLTLRNNGSGEINVTGRIQPVAGVTTDAGVIMDGSGTGLVKLNVASGNTYTGETWVKRGVLELTGASVIEVPANLRIGGAGFAASVDNPADATNGRISNGADLILEAGGTHNLTGATPVERIARLIMRGGSLAQPAGGQLIALDRIHAEGSVASTITTPVLFDRDPTNLNDIDLIHIEAGSSLTLATSSGFFNGTPNPRLRKDGPGPLILQSTLAAPELDCWEGTVILSGAAAQISGTTIFNGGTVTGNGSLFGLASGSAAGSPAGSPGGGTLTPSGPGGTGTGLLTCAGNLLPVTVTHLAFEIGGTTAATQHDQLQVNGTALDLNRCVLDLSLVNGFVPTAGQTFTLINKITGGSPTPRPFAGKDEGLTFSAAGQLWKLTYVGGDGNDVVLTAQGVAPKLEITAFTLAAPAGGAAGLQITATLSGPASTLLSLQASNDLGNLDPWQSIGSSTSNGLGIASFNLTDSAATGPRRFYRVVAP